MGIPPHPKVLELSWEDGQTPTLGGGPNLECHRAPSLWLWDAVPPRMGMGWEGGCLG